MIPIDCNHISTTREWLTPPTIYGHHDQIHYASKQSESHDISQDEIDEWLSGFDAKEFPRNIPVQAKQEPTLEQTFNTEADKWDRETAILSSMPAMVLHESYQRIIAMGPEVVPYLLRDLERSRRSWFWALTHLTKADPVAPEDRGNLDKMVSAWIAWGKRERKI